MDWETADWAEVTQQWLRALRGRRSQRAFSKRLGYGSNIVYRWETGRCAPPASAGFRLIAAYGIDPDRAAQHFLPSSGEIAAVPSLATPEGVKALLERLCGDLKLVELAARTPFTRFTLSRWLRGITEPKLPDLLHLVHAATHRVLDFVAAFSDPQSVAALAPAWRRHVALRNAAFDAPWSHAVLRALELAAYADLPAHEEGWIASRLGLSVNDERHCLRLLAESGQIREEGRRWVVSGQQTIDTGQDPKRARQLRRFWLQQALAQFDAGAKGAYGYNLFCLSTKDQEALTALYAQFFEGMRDIVANSTRGDKVMLFCGQLLEIGAAHKPSSRG